MLGLSARLVRLPVRGEGGGGEGGRGGGGGGGEVLINDGNAEVYTVNYFTSAPSE